MASVVTHGLRQSATRRLGVLVLLLLTLALGRAAAAAPVLVLQVQEAIGPASASYMLRGVARGGSANDNKASEAGVVPVVAVRSRAALACEPLRSWESDVPTGEADATRILRYPIRHLLIAGGKSGTLGPL